MKVGMVSLGCSKNRVDSEYILAALTNQGFTITADPKEAEVILVNTCGFIDPAKEESINTILEMAAYKETGRCKLLVGTGCLTQRYEKELPGGAARAGSALGGQGPPGAGAEGGGNGRPTPAANPWLLSPHFDHPRGILPTCALQTDVTIVAPIAPSP